MSSLRSLAIWVFATVTFVAAHAVEPLKVHLISGSKEYGSEPSLREFAAYLEPMGIQVTASWAQDGGSTLPSVDAIAAADLLVVFARRLKLPEEQMKRVRAHWEAAKPIVGIRTASHAWGDKINPDNALFDREVLGGHYLGHYGDEKVEVSFAPGQRQHPVLVGVQPFFSRKLYKAGDLAPTATPLLFGDNGRGRHAVAWINDYKGSRVFYTSLGVPEDFRDAHFRRMLVNAIFWTTKREPLR